MLKICMENKGSIALFLALILMPIIIFCGLVTDGVRVAAGKQTLAGAADLAANAALSNYNEVVKDVYGLFAISEDMEELKENLEVYFNNTLTGVADMADVDSETQKLIHELTTNFINADGNGMLEMANAELTVAGLPESSLVNPDEIERQILEYMKYRAPANIAMGIMNKFTMFKSLPKQEKAIETKKEFDESLEGIQNAIEEAYKALREYQKSYQDNAAIFDLTDPMAGEQIKGRIAAALNEYGNLSYFLSAYNSNLLKNPKNTGDKTYSSGKEDYETNKTAMAGLVAITNWDAASQISLALGEGAARDKAAGLVRVVETWNSMSNNFVNLKACAQAQVTVCEGLLEDWDEYDDLVEAADELKAEKEAQEAEGSTSDITQEEVDAAYQEAEDAKPSVAKEDVEAQKAEAESQINRVDTQKSLVDQVNAKVGECANESVQQIVGYLSDIHSVATDEKTKMETALETMESLDAAIKDAETARNNWQAAIENMDSGSPKASMEASFNTAAEELNKADIDNLKNTMTEIKDQLQEVIDAVESVKLGGVTGYNGTLAEYAALAGVGSINSSQEVYSFGNFKILPEPASALTLVVGNIKLYDTEAEDPEGADSSQKFWRYMIRLCAASGGSGDEKTQAEDEKKNLLNVVGSLADESVLASGTVGGESADMPDLGGGEGPAAAKKPAAGESSSNTDSGIFSGLGNLANAAAENVYLEEYITGMFSNYITNKTNSGGSLTATDVNGAVSLSGLEYKTSSPFYRAEAEYILWGRSTPKENVNDPCLGIFAIRFILNSSYALMAADLNQYTFTVATAIAGWTGFGVPIVQTVLNLALAAGESALDVKILGAGGSVPFFKSTDSWILSPTGVAQLASSEVKEQAVKWAEDAATNGLNQLFEAVESYTNGAVEAGSDAIKDGLDKLRTNTEQNIRNAATSLVVTPLRNTALQLISSAGEDTDSLIEAKVEDALAGIRSAIETGETGNSITKQAALAALNLFETDYKSALIDTIKTQRAAYQSAVESKVEEQILAVDNTINSTLDTIFQATIAAGIGTVQDKLDEAADTLKNEISEYLAEAKEDAQQKAMEAIERYSNKISGDLAAGASGLDGKGTASTDTTLGDGAFSLNYLDYLRLFIMLGLATDENKDKMLLRTAQLIQMNCNTEAAVGDLSLADKLNLKESYTMISVDASGDIGTLFLNVAIETDEAGKTTYSLNDPGKGVTLNYKSVMGY